MANKNQKRLKAKKDKKKSGQNNKKIEILNNQLKRVLADYDNLKKRIERERQEYTKRAGVRIASKIFSVLDMLYNVQNYLKDPGLAIAIEELKKVLEFEGIEEIRPKNKDMFDEEFYEATEVLETKEKDLDNKVAELQLVGWKFAEGSVIRPAKVKVYKKI